MSGTTPYPARTEQSDISRLDLRRMRGTYEVTTQRNTRYRVQRDSAADARNTDSGRAAVMVSMYPFTDWVPQLSRSPIKVGEEWELTKGHKTSPITQIESAPTMP